MYSSSSWAETGVRLFMIADSYDVGAQCEERAKRKGKRLDIKGQSYNLHVEMAYKKEKIEDSRRT